MESHPDPVRTAIIALGGQGRQFAEHVRRSGKAELACVVEPFNPDGAKAFLAGLGVDCPVFTTVEEAIRKIDFDLGIVASRPEEHEEHTVALLDAGRHVHCEKPPTVELAAMRRVVKASERSGKNVTFNFHLDVQTALLEDNVLRGEIGAVLSVESTWLRALVSAQEREALHRVGLRRGQPPKDPMSDLCHVLRMLVRFLPPGAKISRIQGYGWGVREEIEGAVKYPWGEETKEAHISAKAGWDLPVLAKGSSDRASLTIQGETGAAELNFLLDNRFRLGTAVPSKYNPRLERIEPDGKIGQTVFTSPQPMCPYDCMGSKLEEVVGLVIQGERTLKPADGGLEVMLMLDALRRSIEVGHEVEVEDEDEDESTA